MTQKDFTHRVPLENTRKRAAGFSRSRATLFIFWRCALTLPFVYGHKYSFKPPPWYLDEAIRLSSLIQDHQSSLDRPGVTVRVRHVSKMLRLATYRLKIRPRFLLNVSRICLQANLLFIIFILQYSKFNFVH